MVRFEKDECMALFGKPAEEWIKDVLHSRFKSHCYGDDALFRVGHSISPVPPQVQPPIYVGAMCIRVLPGRLVPRGT